MKKSVFYLVTACIIAILGTQSCKKTPDPKLVPTEDTSNINVNNNNNSNNNNNNNNNNSVNSKANLNTLFAGLRSTPQTFTVTAGTSQTIIGADGVKLKFYPNSFKNAQGTIITSGTVTIKLIEMLRPGDMIANRASTVCNGKPLISRGQVNIKATMNGQEVYANKYGITFPQTAPSLQLMALFIGNINNEDSITNWTLGDTTITGTTVGCTSCPDSFYTTTTFDTCTSFNWINCDYFSNYNGPTTSVSAIMPDSTFTQFNTQVFLVLPTINSVTYMGQYNTTTHTFSLANNYNIPVGMTIHIISIANINGQFYYFEQLGLTSTPNLSVNAVMAPQTLAYIAGQLSQL